MTPSQQRSEPPEPPEWIDLANDIRAVDGNHDLGAGVLAQALTERGWSRAATAAARAEVGLGDAMRAALSDAVQNAGLYEIADAMADAIQNGTFADATEEQVRHAVYELVAKAAIATDVEDAAQQEVPE